MDLQQTLYLIADELRSIATFGAYYASNPYEADRAHRSLQLAAQIAALADEQPLEVIKTIFENQAWPRVSPMLGVDAAVFNARGEILLIQRHDNAHWAMPGGLVEVGESISETVVRELWEEAGMRGEAKQVLGIFDGRLWQSRSKVHIMNFVYQVECQDLTPRIGTEALDARFFAPDQLPSPMHPGHDLRIPESVKALKTGKTFIDPASADAMQLLNFQRKEDNNQP